jgi:PAS domain-containing protein
MVPLLLNRTSVRLQRQLRSVRARLQGAPRTSDVSRVISLVNELSENGSTPAALLADNSARYIAVNDAACVATGWSREELLSLRVWDLTPDVRMDEGLLRWAEFVQNGTSAGAYILKTPRGEVAAHFAASAHVVPDCHLALLQVVPAALLDRDAHA